MGPKEENVVDVSGVQRWLEVLCSEEVLLELVHEDVGVLGCEFGPHGCSVCLGKKMVVEGEDIVVKDEADEFYICTGSAVPCYMYRECCSLLYVQGALFLVICTGCAVPCYMDRERGSLCI